ncbi:MAG: transglycosylase SLT domain-containing protein [Pyrinomonadaceae bacterium]
MTSSFPRWIIRAILCGTFFTPAIIQAQIPAGSSARTTPTEVEKSGGRVDQIIARAEDHFRKGKLNLEDSKREQARDEFDKAVDSILESGLDVRGNQRLQTFYLELVERVYREEVPNMPLTSQPTVLLAAQNTSNLQPQPTETSRKTEQPAPLQIGFRQQQFEPSPLDELSKLILTPEELTVSPADIDALELAKNSVNFAFTTNPLIQGFINHYQGRGRSTMEVGLRRSGRYARLARETFRKEGVPEDLIWLGQVESTWTPKALSYASASGLWQFVPSTGRAFGLRQTAYIDERNSLEKATQASAKYLKALGDHYNGDWALAMAAYNTGQFNVDRAIARAGTANFWKIYPFIAQQTRDYVPNILATILIAKNPDRYGFGSIRREAPLSYDVVQVPTATSLRLIADATDTSVDYLQSLNPELRRDVTPRGEVYNVRVPGGRSKQLLAVLKRVPGDRRESSRVISVAPGEDLQAVANRTGISVAQLQAMNSGVDLKSTTKLVVPNSNVRLTNWKRAKTGNATSDTAPAGPTKIRARKGDTIAKIAAAHKVSADELARLNGMPADAELRAGQEIRLPVSAPTSSRQRGQ